MVKSVLDWSKLCDVALDVRRRSTEHHYPRGGGGKNSAPFIVTENELSMLIVAALEYANRLAHEEGRGHG